MRYAIAKIFGWGLALSLATILVSPNAALARADTQTIHFSGVSQSSPAVNPCTGDSGTLTETVKEGVEHSTLNPDGTTHEAFVIRVDVVFIPDDPAGPTLIGTSTDTFEGNVNRQNDTLTVAFAGHASGSDGSTVWFRGLVHLTVNANGTVTVDFETETARCA
jgi:hypothetical protein